MKKSWGKPIVQVQLFVPQDCIAACQRITDHCYLDFGGNNPNNNRLNYFDNGEEVDNSARVQSFSSNVVGIYTNVNAYSGYNYRDSRYEGFKRTYSKVDIRREGGIWIVIGTIPYFYAYNATS